MNQERESHGRGISDDPMENRSERPPMLTSREREREREREVMMTMTECGSKLYRRVAASRAGILIRAGRLRQHRRTTGEVSRELCFFGFMGL